MIMHGLGRPWQPAMDSQRPWWPWLAVTSHGRTTGYFVSPVEYEELQRYKHLMQRSFATKDLSAERIAAIAGGHMAAEHDHLDALLENE